jgi:uncharacterized protein YutD
MPKEIDESKLNYNKYPGEHVVEFDGVVTVGGNKTIHLVMNFRDAFSAEKLEQRFSEVLDKYDYIVGDFGFEQLRLKGFFSSSRKKMDADSKIDHLEDYINEYCNYGAPYFVLRRIRARDLKNEAFEGERVFEEGERQPKFERPRRKRNRNRNRNRENQENTSYEIREKKDEKQPKSEQKSRQKKKNAIDNLSRGTLEEKLRHSEENNLRSKQKQRFDKTVRLKNAKQEIDPSVKSRKKGDVRREKPQNPSKPAFIIRERNPHA